LPDPIRTQGAVRERCTVGVEGRSGAIVLARPAAAGRDPGTAGEDLLEIGA
jgi:hypothetical protein